MQAPARQGAPASLSVPRTDRPSRTRSYTVIDTERHVVRVTDLDFAAYLLSRDLAIVDATRSRPNELSFDFYDPKDAIRQYAMDYMNSPEARFADCVRRLKKITYSQGRG